jgi:hypothetical protein
LQAKSSVQKSAVVLEMSLNERGEWLITGEGAIAAGAIEQRLIRFADGSRFAPVLRLRMPAAMPCGRFVSVAKLAERSGIRLILIATTRKARGAGAS